MYMIFINPVKFNISYVNKCLYVRFTDSARRKSNCQQQGDTNSEIYSSFKFEKTKCPPSLRSIREKKKTLDLIGYWFEEVN